MYTLEYEDDTKYLNSSSDKEHDDKCSESNSLMLLVSIIAFGVVMISVTKHVVTFTNFISECHYLV